MATNYLNIENVPEELESKVQQSLAFKTGSFVWRVKFNTPLKPSTVNSTNMYLTSDGGGLVKTNIRYDIENNMIEVSPLEPFAEGVTYHLNITTNVRSKGGQKLKKPVTVTFTL